MTVAFLLQKREKERLLQNMNLQKLFNTYISRLGLMGLKLHYATGSAPCFHPVNLSAVQNGVEVLLRVGDGLEVIGVHKGLDNGL